MLKKILLLIFLSVVVIFIPISRIGATQVYIGVKILHASAPGITAVDNNWCLPNSSQMAITDDAVGSCSYTDVISYYGFGTVYHYYNQATGVCSSCPSGFYVPIVGSSPTNYVVTTSLPTCVNGTIWSGLLDLTSGSPYHVYLYTPEFCPGYLNGYCWVAAAANENCCDTCAHYGLTAYDYSNLNSAINCSPDTSNCLSYYGLNDDSDCKNESVLMGVPCVRCTAGAAYDFFDSNSRFCWTTYGGPNQYGSCTWSPLSSPSTNGDTRVCSCSDQLSGSALTNAFYLPFTANF